LDGALALRAVRAMREDPSGETCFGGAGSAASVVVRTRGVGDVLESELTTAAAARAVAGTVRASAAARFGDQGRLRAALAGSS